ncbi:DNA-formamidopyrimidine glycosylase family protein [Antrihabitans cavernicola]|uniref:DNA-(apurinic or apyrimidinic site) lyase n=1 Tax=Antrihabitans cavernicola TaxID=2495913 RepID=A0A5A7SBH6_9NOCA|nr:DNA-formamidopyrimidine glycosylase family protein [Spelaeibacter cavernicola]KAA0022659.1 Fpg/Nei family DNA glycosylase [Spelaeibacter cavernicola]
MPEGDTVFHAAERLRTALVGKPLTRCDIRVPRFATVDLSGRAVDQVVPRGKHLFIRVGDASIHTHLKMEGIWQVLPRGGRWRRPAFKARIVLANDTSEAVGFEMGVVEVLSAQEAERAVAHLGPDLLGPDWDANEAVERLARHADIPISVALLDQRNLAGVGNVFASETCFQARVDPRTHVSEVANLAEVVDVAHKLLTLAAAKPPRQELVYGKAGRPCPRCATPIIRIQHGVGVSAERNVYLCPRCQSGQPTTTT